MDIMFTVANNKVAHLAELLHAALQRSIHVQVMFSDLLGLGFLYLRCDDDACFNFSLPFISKTSSKTNHASFGRPCSLMPATFFIRCRTCIIDIFTMCKYDFMMSDSWNLGLSL